MALDELGAQHRQRAEPARHAVIELVEILGPAFHLKGAELHGIEFAHRTHRQPDHVDAEASIVFPRQALRPMGKELGDVFGLARRPGGIDRQGHHLVVDPVEEQVEALRPQPFRLEPDAELNGEIVRGHKHVVHQGDRVGEAPLGIALGHR